MLVKEKKKQPFYVVLLKFSVCCGMKCTALYIQRDRLESMQQINKDLEIHLTNATETLDFCCHGGISSPVWL